MNHGRPCFVVFIDVRGLVLVLVVILIPPLLPFGNIVPYPRYLPRVFTDGLKMITLALRRAWNLVCD